MVNHIGLNTLKPGIGLGGPEKGESYGEVFDQTTLRKTLD
jgi:hypothetical protein